MDEADKKAIEEQLALRERVLAFKKKQQEFHRETWRRWGLFIGALVVFGLCGWVIYIGKQSFLTDNFSTTPRQYELSWNKNNASWNSGIMSFKRPVESDDNLLPAMKLAISGLFVLSGIGVAVLFAIHIAKDNDDS